MWSSKLIEVFDYVIENNKNATIKEIASKFNISQRSVRYELEKLNEKLVMNEYQEIEIEKGILKFENLNEIREILESYDQYNISSDERESCIILKTLLDREINQREISEELDISKTTVKGHLKEVKKFLEKYNLTLDIQYRKGLELKGKEENIRGALLKILNVISRGNSVYLKNKVKELILDRIDEVGIKRFINYCQKLIEIIISDEAHDIIVNYLKISLYMNKKGYTIESIKNEKFLSETKEYKCIKKGSPILEEWYEVEFSKFEYLKITDYFLGSNTYNLNYSYYDNWVEIEVIVKNMIQEFSDKIEEDISQDKVLLEGLLNHIKPTIYRIKNHIELENSIYKEILESYSHLFEIAETVIKNLEKSMGVKFTEDEISFLVIHFKAAMDRNVVRSEKAKVILVCGSGYGTSKLLAQQIKQYYDVDIVDIIPKYMLEKVVAKECVDLVLTTIDIEKGFTSKPIIKLNSILNDEDKKKIESYGILKNSKKISMKSLIEVIRKNSKELNEKSLKRDLQSLLEGFLVDDIFHDNNTIFDYLRSDRVLINEKVKDWREAIEKVGNLLIKSKSIEESYIKNSIKTIEEFGGYMVLGPQVVFPHARTKGDVNETGFAILTSEEPVSLPSGEKVSVFILFSSKDNKEHLDTFMKLVDLSNKDGFIESIKKIKKSDDFIKLLKREFPD
ncbi:transcription antiterminator [Cetobacterium sp. 2A]|uniref:BglG family transcription antiterminator n=1 Tax=Cetobacterium sp. 2A TaxID=2754723 RepID=UPI00163B97E1|nr:BglG family transcription antiterminator [Cetobacterium sp. 2A]MBC2854967.1 transcription antiterminator [Cetobacterium sp. 2A]